MIKHYVNLTNGIQAIKDYGLEDYSFIRIQSTACEQKLWDYILQDLSHDFLMNVALGNTCIVYDYGSRSDKGVPRAVWQGLEFIKFCLYKCWYDIKYPIKGRAKDPIYFDYTYRNLKKRTKTKLKYFKKFASGSISIESRCEKTDKDGKKNWYVEVVKEN